MRHADWIGNLFSVLFFAALAAASWGLSEYLARGRMDRVGATPPGPSAVIEKPDVVRTGPDGMPNYRIEASRIDYIEREDKSLIDLPKVATLQRDRPASTLQARTATATENQNRIDLEGDVVMTRAAFANQPSMRLTTPQITLLIDLERALTDAPVRLEHGSSVLQGVGMTLDYKTQQIRVLSKSQMTLPATQKK